MSQSKPDSKPRKPSTSSNVLFGIAVVAVVAAGAFLFLRPSAPDTAGAAAEAATAATPAADAGTPAAVQASLQTSIPTAPAKRGVPAGATMPPLPLGDFSPARPGDQVQNAFLFAAEHPEVLQYVPCFCGCESRGHVGNDDCFVSARDAEGNVLAWEPHGVSCAVCIDVATDARRMHSSGASVTQIRTAVENKYRPLAASMTPTPLPESKGSN